MVSHETTQDIWVFAPDSEGPWPVVFTYHGQGGTGDGLATTAENLASHGMLVFSPSFRSTEFQHIEQDLECAYRYGLSIAEDHGGDLDQPITVLGHSFGGPDRDPGRLTEAVYGPGGTYDQCFDGAPRPDVIVSVTACYYESPDGGRYPFDTAGYSHLDADLVVLPRGLTTTYVNFGSPRDATEKLRIRRLQHRPSRDRRRGPCERCLLRSDQR